MPLCHAPSLSVDAPHRRPRSNVNQPYQQVNVSLNGVISRHTELCASAKASSSFYAFAVLSFAFGCVCCGYLLADGEWLQELTEG